MAVAWILVLWGGVMGSLVVRLAAALAFLLINAPLGKPLSLSVSFGLHWAPVVSQISYFVANWA